MTLAQCQPMRTPPPPETETKPIKSLASHTAGADLGVWGGGPAGQSDNDKGGGRGTFPSRSFSTDC